MLIAPDSRKMVMALAAGDAWVTTCSEVASTWAVAKPVHDADESGRIHRTS